MASKDQVFELTKEGFEDVEKELTYRKDVERPRILQAIAEARANGDLSENADYSAAKEAQSENEAKIAELENIVKHHKIIENTTITVNFGVIENDKVKTSFVDHLFYTGRKSTTFLLGMFYQAMLEAENE